MERQHPYSEWSRRSILMQAYAQYEANNYEDAIADADRFIQHTVTGCTRMKTLIDDLLTYSRSGRSGELTGAVDCGELVREVLGYLVQLTGPLSAGDRARPGVPHRPVGPVASRGEPRAGDRARHRRAVVRHLGRIAERTARVRVASCP